MELNAIQLAVIILISGLLGYYAKEMFSRPFDVSGSVDEGFDDISDDEKIKLRITAARDYAFKLTNEELYAKLVEHANDPYFDIEWNALANEVDSRTVTREVIEAARKLCQSGLS